MVKEIRDAIQNYLEQRSLLELLCMIIILSVLDVFLIKAIIDLFI